MWNLHLQPLLVLSCTYNPRSYSYGHPSNFFWKAARKTSTMTGMALDCQQHHTQTTLTTSLGKTGSQEHSLLDIQHPNDHHPYDINSCNIHGKTPLTKNDFLAIFPNIFPNNAPTNILPLFYSTEHIPHTLPPISSNSCHFSQWRIHCPKNSKVEDIAQPTTSMP